MGRRVRLMCSPYRRVVEGCSLAHAADLPNQHTHVIALLVGYKSGAVGVWELKLVALAEIGEVVAIVGFTFLDWNLLQGGGHRHRKKAGEEIWRLLLSGLVQHTIQA